MIKETLEALIRHLPYMRDEDIRREVKFSADEEEGLTENRLHKITKRMEFLEGDDLKKYVVNLYFALIGLRTSKIKYQGARLTTLQKIEECLPTAFLKK